MGAERSNSGEENNYTSRFEFLEAHPEAVTREDLNNFFVKMKGGSSREFLKESHPQIYSSMTVRKWLTEHCKDEEELTVECERHSNRYLDKTAQQFFDDYDLVLDKLGIRDKVEKLRMQLNQMRSRDERRFPLVDELHKLLIPAYLEMRKMGYSHIDLYK